MTDEKTTDPVVIGSTVTRVETEAELDVNTYCLLGGGSFKVRDKDYMVKKQKVSSSSSLLEVYAVDIFKGSKKMTNIMEKLAFPSDLPELKRDAKENFYCPRLFVVNVMLPMYQPQMLGGKENGESFHFVMYLSVSQDVYDSIAAGKTSATKLLKTFLQVDATAQKDYDMRGRLKAVPELLNAKDINLGMLKTLVNNYNSKPFLTGPKYHSFVKTEDYLEVDVDIHRYVYLAKNTFYGLISEIPKMVLNFGLVVEGRGESELPEQMLGGVKMRLDHTKAKVLA